MSKNSQNEILDSEEKNKKKFVKNKINKKSTNPSKIKRSKYTYNLEQNVKNRTISNNENISNNIVYQKPFIKENNFTLDYNNYNKVNQDNLDYEVNNFNLNDDNNKNDNNINKKNIKDDKIKEISNNIKENEIKIEKVNKTMINFFNNKKDEMNNSPSFNSQMNELEKLQQENLTMKADSIIYREDITHLSEINKKLSEELEMAKRKIYDLISKGEEDIQILTNKNYEINQLTESISNLKLSNSPDVLYNIKNNRSKDELIYELQFKINNLNNDKIRVETEKKILEEQYNNMVDENKSIISEDEIYKNNMSNKIYNLENKIKKMENLLEDLSIKNNELKLNNQKCNKNIEILNEEKNDFENKYLEKNEEYDELEKEFKRLENKYSQLLYDTQKQKFIMEKIKNEEEKQNKRKRKISKKKYIVNDLYNNIQMLKNKIQTEREIDN